MLINRSPLYWLATVVLLGLIGACTPQAPEATAPVVRPTPVPTPTATGTQTKTDTISVEGEQRKIVLRRYDNPALPFVTYIPEGYVQDEVIASGEGTVVRFYGQQPGGALNKEAFVQIAFPGEPVPVEKMRESVAGEGGLLDLSQWQLTNRSTDQADLYPWAREKVGFTQPANNIVGAVFVGEHKGTAFTAVEHYPGDFGDAFAPIADKIFSNVELRS